MGYYEKNSRVEAQKTKNYFVINKRLSIERAKRRRNERNKQERKYLKVYLESSHKVIDWGNLPHLISPCRGIGGERWKAEMPAL